MTSRSWSFSSLLLALCLGVTVVSAAGPNPQQDLAVKIHLNRPGCDFQEYGFGVRNFSLVYDYMVVLNGQAKIDRSGPQACCDASFYGTCCTSSVPCSNTYDGQPIQLSAGTCTAPLAASPGFPNCVGEPDACDCDNDTCNASSWCAEVAGAKVTATQWRQGGGAWQVFPTPVVICDNNSLIKSLQCDTASFCETGQIQGGICQEFPSCNPPTCDDGVSCTTDTCENGNCKHEDNCPSGEKCDLGQNVCGDECFDDDDCNDGDPCTDDFCLIDFQQNPATDPGVCRNNPVPNCP